jgi:hypothetical protein
MGYTNSSLVNHKKLSPNHYNGRNHSIDTITIHCVVGQCSVETLGNIFASSSREASSNYGIGYDGRIGLYVEEKNASWCSSSYSNDNRAVTIEVASDTYDPYRVTEKAYKALIKLVADICKRNGIKKLVWSTSKSDRINHKNGCNMTVHRDFANKSCPGDYLYGLHGQIAKEVNKILDSKGDKYSMANWYTTEITMERIWKTSTKNTEGQVKTAQRILRECGYKGKDGKPLLIDGDFGDNTEYAVKSYQKKHGLTVDGIVGTPDWQKLLCEYKK